MKIKFLTTLLIGLIGLTACAPAVPAAATPDVKLITTSAAQTVIANFTLTAASWTATPLPPPSDTPVPLDTATTESITGIAPTLSIGTPGTPGTTVLCDYYTWGSDVDVNVPDGTQMTPGQDFVKTWKITNAGACTWGAGYKIVYAGYTDKMSGLPQPLSGVIGPGQDVQISVQFKAPIKAGTYVSAWTLSNANGRLFFGIGAKPLYLKIVVKL